MRERGYSIVYTPHAKLLHYEAKTKVKKPQPYEVRYAAKVGARHRPRPRIITPIHSARRFFACISDPGLHLNGFTD
jgi:hypothetical protein